MRFSLPACVLVASLCACSGGRYVGPRRLGKDTRTGSQRHVGRERRSRHDGNAVGTAAPGPTASPAPTASAKPTATPQPTPSPEPFLSVSNNKNDSDVVFPTTATGDATPVGTLKPARTSCSGVAASPDGSDVYYAESDDKTIFNVAANSDFTSPAIAAIGVFAIDSSAQI
jgi:hypothetical protein